MRKLVLELALVGWVGLSASLTDAMQVDSARKNLAVAQTLRALDIQDSAALERASFANALLDVRVETHAGQRIVLVTERSPRVNLMAMKNEGKIVVDLFDTVNLLEQRSVPGPMDSLVLRARSSQFEVVTDLTARVVLDLTRFVDFTHEITSEGLMITLLDQDGRKGLWGSGWDGHGGNGGNGGNGNGNDADTLELQPIELKPMEETPMEMSTPFFSSMLSDVESLIEEEDVEKAPIEEESLPDLSREDTIAVRSLETSSTHLDDLNAIGSPLPLDERDSLTASEVEDFLDMAVLKEKQVDKLVTITFAAHTSLVEAINALARVGNLNVVVDPAVDGEVTARLVNVPLKVAMQSLLIVNGYDYIEKDGVYRVVPLEKTGQSDVETKTLIRKLEYVDAKSVEDSCKPFVTKEYGTISMDKGSNTLVVKDIPPVVDSIESMIEAFDQRTMQVYVEAAVIDVRVEEGTAFGFNWYGPSVNYGDWGTPGNYTPTRSYSASSPLNNRFWQGATTGWGHDGSFLPSGPQVGPQQLLGKMDHLGNLKYPGTDSVRLMMTGMDPITNTVHGIFGGFIPGSLQQLSTLTANFQILTDQFGFQGVLSAADNSSDIEVLAMPTILTLDNKEATVSVTEKLPYVEYRYDKDTGVITDVSYKTEDVRIQLIVKPHITTDKQVLMDVRINKDEGTYEEFQVFGGLSTRFPNVTERFIQTSTIIVDGNTLVMGGLRDTREQKLVRSIPFLGRLPLIGWLFRGEDISSRDYELIVFLTPHIIEPGFQITERDRTLYETSVTHADNMTIDPYHRLGPYYDMHHRSEYVSPHDLRTTPGGKTLKKDGALQWKYW